MHGSRGYPLAMPHTIGMLRKEERKRRRHIYQKVEPSDQPPILTRLHPAGCRPCLLFLVLEPRLTCARHSPDKANAAEGLCRSMANLKRRDAEFLKRPTSPSGAPALGSTSVGNRRQVQ